MTRRFRVGRQANLDLDSIAIELGAASPTSALRVLDKLYDTFLFLSENPASGTLRDDLAPELRFYCPSRPASRYIIFFYPIPDGVAISDIIHSSRDWLTMFRAGERGEIVDGEQAV